MKAFITGGAGFIGSSMADRLLLGRHNSVTVFDNFSSGRHDFLPKGMPQERFKIVASDVLDINSLINAMEGHDVVYHFCSNPDIAKGAEDTSLDLNQGIVATYHVLESMRQTGVKKIVFASGTGVYGDTGGVSTAENYSPMMPISLYGASKLSAEALISSFCHMFDLQGYVFRLANVVGGRQTHGVAFDFIQKLRSNPQQLTIFGDGCQNKSYIHIDDVLDAIFFVLAMSNEKVNLFNAGTEDTVDVNWIAKAVVSKMNLENVQFNYTGGSRGWPGDVPVVRMDVSKLAKRGWKARYNSQAAVGLAIDQMISAIRNASAAQP